MLLLSQRIYISLLVILVVCWQLPEQQVLAAAINTGGAADASSSSMMAHNIASADHHGRRRRRPGWITLSRGGPVLANPNNHYELSLRGGGDSISSSDNNNVETLSDDGATTSADGALPSFAGGETTTTTSAAAVLEPSEKKAAAIIITQQQPSSSVTTTTNNNNSPPSSDTTTTATTTTTKDDATAPAVIASSWRKALPDRLRQKGPKTLQRLVLGDTIEIYLLGTAHVSNDSSADVDLLLHFVKPDCIFTELCDARIALLEGTTTSTHQQQQNTTSSNETSSSLSFWKRVQSTQQAQGGSRMQAMSTVLLTSVQEDYASQLGVELGGEFRCAYAYWQKQKQKKQTTPRNHHQDGGDGGNYDVHLILGDRPLSLTLVRAWESLTWWPKLKVVAGLLWSSWRKPNAEEIRAWLQTVLDEETDVLTESFLELQQHFPTLYTTIISERDAWLAAKLVQTCRALRQKQQQQQQHYRWYTNNNNNKKQQYQTVVAIVGAGHVPGICKWLTTQQSNNNNNETPEQILSRLVTTRKWAKDTHVVETMIPSWIHDVPELNDNVVNK